LPYSQFVPWALSGGSISDIIALSFVNQIAGGITLDALTAGLFLIGFIFYDRKNTPVKNIWLPIIGIFVFGIAFAFPCYFYLRSLSSKVQNISK